jgi:ABC-type branched-subunit amino acid transport system ATPase component
MGRTFQISNVFTDLTVLENLLLSIVGTDARKWIMYRPVSSFAPSARRRSTGSRAWVSATAPPNW